MMGAPPEADRTPLARLDRALEFLLVTFVAAMTVVVAFEIFSRQFFDRSWSWAEETARFLLVFTGILGGSYCVKRGSHLGIDALVRILPRRLRLVVELFTTLLILAFSLLVLVWGGLLLRATNGDQSASAVRISFSLLYLVFPLAGLLNSAYCLERLWLMVKNRGEARRG